MPEGDSGHRLQGERRQFQGMAKATPLMVGQQGTADVTEGTDRASLCHAKGACSSVPHLLMWLGSKAEVINLKYLLCPCLSHIPVDTYHTDPTAMICRLG